jgi:hypothetical protein
VRLRPRSSDWRTASGSAWASDLDPVVPLRYGKRYGRHRYSALFDPTADQQPGTYRFLVTGAYATGPAATTEYTLESEAFVVSASDDLRLVQRDDGLWTVEHPEPDRLRNYRWRARSPESWLLTGTLNGLPFTTSSPFELSAGDQLVVAPGGIVDLHGNSNADPIVVAVP